MQKQEQEQARQQQELHDLERAWKRSRTGGWDVDAMSCIPTADVEAGVLWDKEVMVKEVS